MDATDYGKKVAFDPVTGQSIEFIPARVYDNHVIMQNDPTYVKRLENLPEQERKAFLDGDWDLFQGQYFSEFRRSIHVYADDDVDIRPHWRRYVAMDYGLDMLAAYFIAVDENSKGYIYREIHESNLIISEAVERIKSSTIPGEKIDIYYAPPDLWNRRQDTGKSAADIFQEFGICLYKASNDRVQGWLNMKEWLRVVETRDEQTGKKLKTAALRVHSSCRNLIKSLAESQYDDKNPNDVSKEPHILSHSVDAVRYFLSGRPSPAYLEFKRAAAEDDDDDDRDNDEEGWFE